MLPSVKIFHKNLGTRWLNISVKYAWGLQPKKRLQRSRFPVNFAKFFRKLFLIEHLYWLLLSLITFIFLYSIESFLTLKAFQPYRMVKHTQAIRWLQPMNCLSMFDHFVELALKALSSTKYRQICFLKFWWTVDNSA